MKIAVMLRHLGKQAGGIGVYTDRLLKELLNLDDEFSYLFLYADRRYLGAYASSSKVEEVAVPVPIKLLWDQIVVPYVARRHEVGAILNLKASVPLLSGRPTAFTLPGADWFAFPHQYPLYDRLYVKAFARLYFRRAKAVLSVSHDSSKRIADFMGYGADKIWTIHQAVDARFRPRSRDELAAVREKYGLPERFILYLGQIYTMKNVGRIIQAFAQIRSRIPHKLVIAGKPQSTGKKDLAWIDRLDLGESVITTGYLPDEDVPAMYNLADLFLFPSLFEGFGIPLVEAMASGCPVVTSTAGSCPEVVDDAAEMVDPLDIDAIAQATYRVLTDDALRAKMIEKGLSRARAFQWRDAAIELRSVLRRISGSAFS